MAIIYSPFSRYGAMWTSAIYCHGLRGKRNAESIRHVCAMIGTEALDQSFLAQYLQ
jgi:hypothetical protein